QHETVFRRMIQLIKDVCKLVSRALQPPRNVRITSHNMDLVLRWDPPEGAASGLFYTTEYNTSVSVYKVGCLHITALSCDFTSLNHHITVYGQYTARVRAELGEEKSAWVESTQITMDRDTMIGQPNVSLISSKSNIEVSIEDPEFRISELRHAYNYATYNITYWKEGQEEKAESISNIQQNRVILDKLEPWTRYCVRVQINTQRNLNPSEPSSVTCESTDKESPWVAAVVTFVVMAMLVTLAVVAVVHRKKMSHFLCPKDSLPQHFKKHLLEHPSSSIYLAMRDSHPPEEVYDQVSVIAEGNPMEEERPLEAAGTNCSSQPETTVGQI
uniref:Interleukin 10 receptor subunit beta n=1 Tax=Myripristis murdjan TaxID=586833 RepID=A0A667YH97_9TELE